jgi:hypothetical protein
MGWLARLLRRERPAPPGPDADATFERLQWLEGDDSPFGVRVLDCRPVADTFLSGTVDPLAIRFFLSPAARSGEQFRGQHPEAAVRVPCRIEYPGFALPPEGPAFVAKVMEDKWNVYRLDDALYFVRSWTGQLVYVAQLAAGRSGWGITEVEAWPAAAIGPPDMAVRQVDYLIRSHLYGLDVPHPVPTLGTKQALALWSFSQYGRRGRFAVPVAGPGGSAGEPAAPTDTSPNPG